ncbi:MAG: hypothetical protein ABEI31_08275 [Halodesulfurarchaeum sp.]
MEVPTLVADALGDEEVAAHVPLNGEDGLFVTRTRTIHYRSEGLISDESVDAYPHDAERVEVGEGRRKATIRLDYGTGGVEEFSVPSRTVDDALHPVLAGVLSAAGVTEAGETVKRTFRFSELTLVVTSARIVKHIGSAVWDREYEEVPFEALRGYDVEEGSVASQIVLTTDDRMERIKAPTEAFREVEETVREAIYEYFDVTTEEEFERVVGGAETEDVGEPDATTETGEVSFEGGVDPIGASRTGSEEPDEADSASVPEAAEELEESGFTAATTKVQAPVDPDELRTELDRMEEALEEQRALIERQLERIEALREHLSGE